MKPKTTWVKRRGKGAGAPASPGPTTKKEWLSIGMPLLRLRKVLLHSDGARAYKYTPIPGVVVTSVKHKKPMPIYAARRLVRLPHRAALAHTKLQEMNSEDRKAVQPTWVMSGTQLIDNTWRRLKSSLPKELHGGDEVLEEYTREYQWKHWHAEDDLWKMMGQVISRA